jgi:acetolactate synthase I/II/III large subunit
MARTTQYANSALGAGKPSNALYGSDLMVEMLRELGIRYIALNPGASFRGLHDSLVNFGEGGPEILMCAHEEFAVAMANGYARVTGKPMATGLHNVVGLQHAAMAIFNAWCDRTPMLNLGGGGPQDATHRRSTDWVHTALVQGNLVRDFVKFDDQPYSIEAVPESFLRAYRIAMTEPRGPVYLCLDSDLQEQRIESPMMVPNAALFAPPALPAANPEALQRAADLLVGAQWPVIVAGEVGRNPTALPALLELAETLASPVIEAGRFAISNTHPLDLTPRREWVLNHADVVLALDVPSLGVPLGPSVRERGALQPAIGPNTTVIHITLNDLEKQSWVTDNMRMMPVAVPIAADTAQAIPELERLCRKSLMAGIGSKGRVEQRRGRVHAIRQQARKEADAWVKRSWDQVPISSARLHGELNQRLKGQPWALAHTHGARWRDVLETTDEGHGLGGGRGAGVGYGLPSSIGAALGWQGSGRLVVSVLGDGDFFMTSNALWTAAKYDIPLLVIIYNNRSYYNDEDHQERIAAWRDRPVENKGVGVRIEDPEPDFASLARSLGAAGFGPVTDPDKVGDVLDEAIAVVRSGQPAVIDVHTQAR